MEFEVDAYKLQSVSHRLTNAVGVADQVKHDRDGLKEDATKLAGLLDQAATGYIQTETGLSETFRTDG
jgi:hypothetical protein